MPKLILRTIRGDARDTRLGDTPVSIGRGQENILCIRDERASRLHCVIEQDARGGFQVRDLASRNGTRINDTRVMESPLRPGDILKIGHHEFLVELDEVFPESATPQQIAGMGEPGEVDLGPEGTPPEPPPIPAYPSMDEAEHVKLSSESMEWVQKLEDLIDSLPPRDAQKESVSLVDATGKNSQALTTDSVGPMGMRLLLRVASKSRATDIHIEPKGDRNHIRMRIDGQMVSIVDLPARVGELVYGIIKTAAQIKMAAREPCRKGTSPRDSPIVASTTASASPPASMVRSSCCGCWTRAACPGR